MVLFFLSQDQNLVRETLEEYAYDVDSTIDYILHVIHMNGRANNGSKLLLVKIYQIILFQFYFVKALMNLHAGYDNWLELNEKIILND